MPLSDLFFQVILYEVAPGMKLSYRTDPQAGSLLQYKHLLQGRAMTKTTEYYFQFHSHFTKMLLVAFTDYNIT